ncbi:MAG: hypothetical protein ACYCZF_12630 [Anaerolineae bacterium]
MKRTVVARFVVLLIGMTIVMMLGGCNPVPGQQTSAQSTSQPKAATATKASNSRIDQLLGAWSDAGLKTELRETLNSPTINAMYGCIRMYHVFLDDRMAIVLEFDLQNLNSTAKSQLDYIDKNGTERRSDEPAWRNQEFVLLNHAVVLENGEAIAEFNVTEHPASEQLLEAFSAFK